MSKTRSSLKVWSLDELANYRHPDEGKIVVDKINQTCTLKFKYPYEVDLDRIKSERDLLCSVRHLAEKDWMTGQRISMFIDVVAKEKGFKVGMTRTQKPTPKPRAARR